MIWLKFIKQKLIVFSLDDDYGGIHDSRPA